MALLERIRAQAAATPSRAAVILLDRNGEVRDSVDYRDLVARTDILAAELSAADAGHRVLVSCSPGPRFAVAFLGVLRAGCVPVPTYPPGSTPDSRQPGRLASLANRVSAGAMITDEAASSMEPAADRLPDGLCLARASSSADAQAGPSDEDIALLQLTSGSTGRSRAVQVRESGLMANISSIVDAFGIPPGVNWVSWLPTYHDMGLIAGLLAPMTVGSTAVVMDPETFIARPIRWLRAITAYEGYFSAAPNFAYDLCVRRVSDTDLESLDLSCWHVAGNGAEPVRRRTLERFAERFAPVGFRESALHPSYGLAEATLLVSCGPWKRDGASIEDADPPVVESVSCGRPAPGVEIEIVDTVTGRPLAEGETGEVLVHGSGVAAGYFDEPELTTRTFGAALPRSDKRYLCTGDLGRVVGGELFIVGRKKDVLTFRGRQIMAEEVEAAAQGFDDVRACAAVTVDGRDALVICEVADTTDSPDLRVRIHRAVVASTGLSACDVLLVEKGWIPKTSSGKVRRGECRQRLAVKEQRTSS